MMKNNVSAAAPQGKSGIYVHVPFCVRKCLYCDFASYAGCSEREVDAYFDALGREIRMFCDAAASADAEDMAGGITAAAARALPADSLFIGGGTPSSVDPHYIADTVNRIPLSGSPEITMEANPGTVDSGSLAVYRKAGICRLSFGVQSFNDDELKFLGRIHSAAEAEVSLAEARAAGFDNVNLDLMFGFPGQTMESWIRSLETAVRLGPEHISFYSLQIEEGTPLYDMFRQDQVQQIPDELNRRMYHYATDFLAEHGYRHYEISNAARPGRECRHNLKYWTMQPYIGFGAGAHSFIGGIRYANPDDIGDYIRHVNNLEAAGGYFSPEVRNFRENSIEDSMSDHMFTGLRLTEGISISEFEKRYDINFMERYGDAVRCHVEDGTMRLENGRLSFTGRGLDISNSVLIDFI